MFVPVDDETKRLVKLGLGVAPQSDGAVRSHVRRGLEEGHDSEALEYDGSVGPVRRA